MQKQGFLLQKPPFLIVITHREEKKRKEKRREECVQHRPALWERHIEITQHFYKQQTHTIRKNGKSLLLKRAFDTLTSALLSSFDVKNSLMMYPTNIIRERQQKSSVTCAIIPKVNRTVIRQSDLYRISAADTASSYTSA